MAGTTLSEAIERYMAYREGNQMAPNTLRTNRRALSMFMAHVGNIQMWHMNSTHGASYRAHLTEKKYQPNTVHSHLDSLKGFIGWAHEQRLLPPTSNPLYGIRRPKILPKKRRRIPASGFAHLLDCAHLVDANGITVHGSAHDRIVVALGLYLLLRQSEIASLRMEDVDLENGFIDVVLHKTSGRDSMPISQELDGELRRWMKWYANDTMAEFGPMGPTWYLVGSKRPTELETTPGVRWGRAKARLVGNSDPSRPFDQPHRAVQRALVRFGVPVRGDDGKSLMEGVHTLRRSGARARYDWLVEKGHDGALRDVQALLHHSTTAMTERYIGIDVDIKRRNESVRGKLMYPQAAPSDNVVPFRVTEAN